MCTFDWSLFANVVTALGTLGLVTVGGFAARYAYNTAIAAINALGLEAEPILMVGIDPNSPTPNQKAKVTEFDDGRQFLLSPATALVDLGTAYFTVKNIGRSPAMNLTVQLRVEEAEGGRFGRRWIQHPLFIESLSPQERFVIGIHNATSTVVKVGAVEAKKASVTTKGKVEAAQLFVSTAMPFPLVPGDA